MSLHESDHFERRECNIYEMTFQEFDDLMRLQVCHLDSKDYKEVNTSGEDIIATVSNVPTSMNLHEVCDTEIFINLDKYSKVERHKRKAIMDITLTHEIVELWEILAYQLHPNDVHGRGKAHKIALIHEFAHAHSLGLHDDYLKLVKSWARNMTGRQRTTFVQENIQAHAHVVANNWQPSRDYLNTTLNDAITLRNHKK